MLLEPQGKNPFVVFVDSTIDDDKLASDSDPIVDELGNQINQAPREWRPDLDLLEAQRADCIKAYQKLLE